MIEYRARRASGALRWIRARESVFARAPDGSPRSKLGIAQDITVEQEREEPLRQLSLVDPLTGLGNRRSFDLLVEQELKTMSRNGKDAALVFLDLDDFKSINDNYGHAEGDRALREAADMLRESFRSSDIIARIGGDGEEPPRTARSDGRPPQRPPHEALRHRVLGGHVRLQGYGSLRAARAHDLRRSENVPDQKGAQGDTDIGRSGRPAILLWQACKRDRRCAFTDRSVRAGQNKEKSAHSNPGEFHDPEERKNLRQFFPSPRDNPGTRALVADRSRDQTNSGLPFLAMMDCSPAKARFTSREKWDRASRILTCISKKPSSSNIPGAKG